MTENLNSDIKTRFARSPADAVQCLHDLVVGTENIIAKCRDPQLRSLISGTTLNFLINGADADDWRTFITDIPIYFWTHETAKLVAAASKSYPLEEEEALTLEKALEEPTRPPGYWPKLSWAFCVFEQPILFYETEFGTKAPLAAIAWRNGFWTIGQEFWIQIRGIDWMGGVAAPCWWADGGTKGTSYQLNNGLQASFAQERLIFTKWICTASMFLEQDVVAAEIRHNRGLDRRYRKDKVYSYNRCRVVTLRVMRSSDGEASGQHGIDWQHRWLVRGHWRRQWFPRAQRHCPIWIHPHVKGPADKSFKDALQTVYAVRR